MRTTRGCSVSLHSQNVRNFVTIFIQILPTKWRKRKGMRATKRPKRSHSRVHYCNTRKDGAGFQLGRKTKRKRLKAKLRELKETLRRHRHTPIDEQGRWLGAMMKGHFAYFAVPDQHIPAVGLPLSYQHHLVSKSAATQPAAPADVGTDGQTYQAIPTVTARTAPVAKPSVQRQILEVGTECVSSARSDLCGGWTVMAISTAINGFRHCQLTRNLQELLHNLATLQAICDETRVRSIAWIFLTDAEL
jgi:hypothetical protein